MESRRGLTHLRDVFDRIEGRFRTAYERHLERELSDPPSHVAIIQDGNRRYAEERRDQVSTGHQEGAKTTEQLLHWCDEYDIDELTLYAFSTENFERKFHEFADDPETHDKRVRIRTIGDRDRLPDRVRSAAAYADRRTRGYDGVVLNVALAYGGRATLLDAAKEIAHEAASGTIDPDAIDVSAVEERLYDGQLRDVDLIIRTGGDERTSNFLPWHASGNEAAVVFCAPYWPAFSKIDFLRCLRTYEQRQASLRQTRAERAVALLRAFRDVELDEARSVAGRLRDLVPEADNVNGRSERTAGIEPFDGITDTDREVKRR